MNWPGPETDTLLFTRRGFALRTYEAALGHHVYQVWSPKGPLVWSGFSLVGGRTALWRLSEVR